MVPLELYTRMTVHNLVSLKPMLTKHQIRNIYMNWNQIQNPSVTLSYLGLHIHGFLLLKWRTQNSQPKKKESITFNTQETY